MIRWFLPAPGERVASFRLAPVFFGLLALAIQSFVVQTHVHAPAEYLHLAGTANAPGGPSHGKSPGGDDPVNCPLCREIMLAGSFVAPAPIILPIPVVAESHVAVFREAFAVTVLSHSWHGRAPPSEI
jgi:hypothetical protein